MSLNGCESLLPMLLGSPDEVSAAHPDTCAIIDLGETPLSGEHGAIRAALEHRRHARGPTYLRIRMAEDEPFQALLTGLAGLRPDGLVLAACGAGADIQKLDVMLRVAEAQSGVREGSLGILAETGEVPSFFLATSSLRNLSRRLSGILFNPGALTEATSSQPDNSAAGRPGAPLVFARATVVLRAAEAGQARYEFLGADLQTAEALLAARDASLADGFSSVVVRTAAQLAVLTTA